MGVKKCGDSFGVLRYLLMGVEEEGFLELWCC